MLSAYESVMSGTCDFSASTCAASVMALAVAPAMMIAPSWSIMRRVRLAAWVGFSEVVSAGAGLCVAPPRRLVAPPPVVLSAAVRRPPPPPRHRARAKLAQPAGQRIGSPDHDVALLRPADARQCDRRGACHQSLESCSARDFHGFPPLSCMHHIPR